MSERQHRGRAHAVRSLPTTAYEIPSSGPRQRSAASRHHPSSSRRCLRMNSPLALVPPRSRCRGRARRSPGTTHSSHCTSALRDGAHVVRDASGTCSMRCFSSCRPAHASDIEIRNAVVEAVQRQRGQRSAFLLRVPADRTPGLGGLGPTLDDLFSLLPGVPRGCTVSTNTYCTCGDASTMPCARSALAHRRTLEPPTRAVSSAPDRRANGWCDRDRCGRPA